MNLKDKMIIDEYKKQKDSFVEIGNIVHEKLRKIADSLSISPLGIEHRVKAEKSLIGKLLKDSDWYQKFDDITDILGARVICFFSDEVDQIGNVVKKEFKIDWENSSDKRAVIDAESFGYLSLHYICSLKEDEGYPPELLGKRFEIQVRTGLQHIWAAIDHDIAYKSKFGVPREITREFSRLAGLLEIADEAFVHARDNMNSYIKETHRKIVENCADDIKINMISLKEYMLYNVKMREFLNELASIECSEITETDPENYIEQLRWLGKNSLGDLQNMLNENSDLALSLAKQSLSGTELDILSSSVALRFLCRAQLLIGDYTLSQVAEFISLSVGDKSHSDKQAKRLFKVYEQIKGAN